MGDGYGAVVFFRARNGCECGQEGLLCCVAQRLRVCAIVGIDDTRAVRMKTNGDRNDRV